MTRPRWKFHRGRLRLSAVTLMNKNPPIPGLLTGAPAATPASQQPQPKLPSSVTPLFAVAPPAVGHEVSFDTKLAAAAAAAGLAGLKIAPKATGKAGYLLTAVRFGPGGKLHVSPLASMWFFAPPPFGMAAPKTYGLPSNYGRRLLEQLGVPSDVIPSSGLLATKKNTPAIDAEYERTKAFFALRVYRNAKANLTNEQLKADFALFTHAARGNLGAVPLNIDVQRMADEAREELAHRSRRAGTLELLLGTTALPQLPPLPSPLPPVPVIPDTPPPAREAGVAGIAPPAPPVNRAGQELDHVTAIDRLFAANPPDP